MLGALLEKSPFGCLAAAILTFVWYQLLRLQDGNSRPKYSFIADAYKRVQKIFLGVQYVFAGAAMIDEAYFKANGKSFVIQSPGKQHVMVTSQNHIKELNAAPLSALSLHAVAKDFLQPKHTMHGFEWKDQRGVEGTGFVRALRSLLTSHLPLMLPKLSSGIAEEFEKGLVMHKPVDGYHYFPVFAMAKRIVTRANCIVFFGPELSENQAFVDVALQFPEDVFLAAEVLRIMPTLIAPSIAKLVTRRHRSSRAMYDFLYPVVNRRLQRRNIDEIQPQGEKPSDGVQWLVDTSPKRDRWSTDRLVGEIMAIWYGSVHTLAISTTYAIIDLYSHEDCISALRNEVQGAKFDGFQKTADGLPVLDSFLKESARVSAFESTGVRRQALIPFSFSDGLHISTGDWVCVPHRSMMRDPRNFENPLEFDAFRSLRGPFAPNETAKAPSKLVDTSDKWLVWGSGRIVCPGRFYATLVLKLIMAHMLLKYDCKLQDIKGSRSRQWRSAIIPRASIALYVRPRRDADPKLGVHR